VVHPLVEQLRFARAEFQRALAGVSEEDGVVRLEPSNSIGWTVAHMATQERAFWVTWGQGITDVAPELDGWQGAVTPPLGEAWAAWQAVVAASDPYLDGLTDEAMGQHLVVNGAPYRESLGTMFLRAIYHYWYHIGEASAFRQQLGHVDLPPFVGNLGVEAPYRAGA
jgi:uncharacterized damage-inducible protein DinB